MNNLFPIFFLLINVVQSFNQADPFQFPYYVSIWRLCTFTCSGTLISLSHVLTVGHCVNDIPNKELLILAGTINLLVNTGYLDQVKKIWIHHRFTNVSNPENSNNKRYVHDIAIIKVTDPFRLSHFLHPVDLLRNNIEMNVRWQVPGWNEILMENGDFSISAIWIDGNFLSDEKCSDYAMDRLINEQCIERGIPGQKHAGSPVVFASRIYGIIVGGEEVMNMPSIVLNISPYLDWIDHVLDDKPVDVNLTNFNYIVSIRYEKFHFCSGTMIHSLFVLTSASCVKKLGKHFMKVVTGSNLPKKISRYGKYKHSKISKIIYHDDFQQTENYSKNDIAILELERQIMDEEAFSIPKLLQKNHYPQGSCQTLQLKVIDGYIKWQSFSSILLSLEDCKKIYEEAAGPSDGCIGSVHSFPTLNTYSYGEPIICGDIVIGIIVRKFVDDDSTISSKTTYTKISNFYEFITNVVGTN